jgi:EAL domain-containing protein (putative c-di-GMP-specific phosphodiesterase class I)/FixJ family two-component response regulator
LKFDDKSQLDTAKTALSTGMPIEGRWGAANEIGAAAIFYCSNRRDKRARKVFSGEGYRFSRRTRRYGIVSWLAVQWSGAAMRVLVFDDDEAIGRVLCKAAIKMGIDAVVVGDQDEFSAQMLSDPPHVVILDLQLGTTDGVKQLRMLASGKFAGAVVLMSGFDARVLASARELSIHLGLNVAGVLEKPLRLASLQDVLARLRISSEPLMIERLQQAIANGELSLHLQPIVSRTPRTLKKMEALVRWIHPALGMIQPADFVPIAESDLATIDALTKWVVIATVEAYRSLAAFGISVPLSINLSAQNLHDLTLPDFLEACLPAGGMPASHLHIEITETTAFGNPSHTMDVLSRLRLKGMSLSIDDFGTGYASLKALRQMPFSEIKIDRSFVSDITTSRDSRAIVKSIADLASNMEMDCVAEGVESEETADLLEQIGIASIQGYLIAKPMATSEIPAWFASWMQAGAGAAAVPDRSPPMPLPT